MMNDFEKAAAYLLPYDPIAKKRTSQGSKCNIADIYDVKVVEGGANVSAASASSKLSVGKTGVEFRFYTKSEYDKLNKAQKNELHEWRASNGRSSRKKARKSDDGGNRNQTKTIIAAVKQYHEEQAKVKQQEAEQDDAL